MQLNVHTHRNLMNASITSTFLLVYMECLCAWISYKNKYTITLNYINQFQTDLWMLQKQNAISPKRFNVITSKKGFSRWLEKGLGKVSTIFDSLKLWGNVFVPMPTSGRRERVQVFRQLKAVGTWLVFPNIVGVNVFFPVVL